MRINVIKFHRWHCWLKNKMRKAVRELYLLMNHKNLIIEQFD